MKALLYIRVFKNNSSKEIYFFCRELDYWIFKYSKILMWYPKFINEDDYCRWANYCFATFSSTLYGYGCNPEALHRVVAISSGALDSLPHNGYVVTTIQSICGEKHSAAYWPVAATTVVVPALGVILAIILFSFNLGI